MILKGDMNLYIAWLNGVGIFGQGVGPHLVNIVRPFGQW